MAGIFSSICACAPKTAYVPPPAYAPMHPSSPAPPRSKTGVVEHPPYDTDRPKTVTHEVAPLETIWRLSRMYDVPEDTIRSANGLKAGEPIHIGQKLIIPNANKMRHVIALYRNPQWKYIIIHHTATDIGNACLIDRSHQDRGFWNGLGYHFIIDNGSLGKGDGQIEESPRWVKQQNGAHCKAGGMNEKGIGIALVGNFSQELPTRKQMDSLTYLLKTLCSYYHISSSNVMGHRDVEGACTECPGKRFPWSSVRQCLSSY